MYRSIIALDLPSNINSSRSSSVLNIRGCFFGGRIPDMLWIKYKDIKPFCFAVLAYLH